jgi:hypothetical protein
MIDLELPKTVTGVKALMRHRGEIIYTLVVSNPLVVSKGIFNFLDRTFTNRSIVNN